MYDDNDPWANWPVGNPWADADDEYPRLGFNIFGANEDEAEAVGGRGFAIAIAVASVVLILVFFLLYKFVHILIDFVLTLDKFYGPSLVTVVVILVSGFLFYMKENHTVKYGLIETTFAAGSASAAVKSAMNGGASWLLVLGAMYVVVRGLDNINKGVEKWRKIKSHLTPPLIQTNFWKPAKSAAAAHWPFKKARYRSIPFLKERDGLND